MEFIEMEIEGLFLIKPRKFEDSRGKFVKTFHMDTFKEQGLSSDFKEGYYSTSQKNVLRGMHFQTPPHDHDKLVYVPHGSIIDVVLDIREGSSTYGKYVKQELNSDNGYIFYIPKGCAHGFLSLEDNTNVTYMQTTMYADNSDGGIKFDSFGCDWGDADYIVSDRDNSFTSFTDFVTPFKN